LAGRFPLEVWIEHYHSLPLIARPSAHKIAFQDADFQCLFDPSFDGIEEPEIVDYFPSRTGGSSLAKATPGRRVTAEVWYNLPR